MGWIAGMGSRRNGSPRGIRRGDWRRWIISGSTMSRCPAVVGEDEVLQAFGLFLASSTGSEHGRSYLSTLRDSMIQRSPLESHQTVSSALCDWESFQLFSHHTKESPTGSCPVVKRSQSRSLSGAVVNSVLEGTTRHRTLRSAMPNRGRDVLSAPVMSSAKGCGMLKNVLFTMHGFITLQWPVFRDPHKSQGTILPCLLKLRG